MTPQDVLFMERAIQIAKRGIGKVSPNPIVGAVLVKSHKIIGEGAHLRFGGPHAEVNAILNAKKKDLAGATLYVSLEPCAHQGKTPPCADLILKKNIRRVVIGARDPNPAVSGRGVRILKQRGVKVLTGVLEREASELNKGYNRWIRTKRPYVIVKAAQSLDGKIATRTGQSRWISGEAARQLGHELRAASGAILVGVNTVLRDNPRLDVRHAANAAQPVKVVLDSALRIRPASRLFSSRVKTPVILAVTKKAPKSKFKRFRGKAEIWVMREKNGRVDLKQVLERLGRRGICQVLIEGGGEVIGDAFLRRIVNEVYFLIAPLVIGGRQAVGSVGGSGIRKLSDAYRFKKIEVQKIGEDVLIHGEL